MTQATMTIQGMTCDHCVRGVRKALEELGGVQVEAVEIGSARVAYDPEQVGPDQIRGAVEEEGYSVRELKVDG